MTTPTTTTVANLGGADADRVQDVARHLYQAELALHDAQTSCAGGCGAASPGAETDSEVIAVRNGRATEVSVSDLANPRTQRTSDQPLVSTTVPCPSCGADATVCYRGSKGRRMVIAIVYMCPNTCAVPAEITGLINRATGSCCA